MQFLHVPVSGRDPHVLHALNCLQAHPLRRRIGLVDPQDRGGDFAAFLTLPLLVSDQHADHPMGIGEQQALNEVVGLGLPVGDRHPVLQCDKNSVGRTKTLQDERPDIEPPWQRRSTRKPRHEMAIHGRVELDWSRS